MRILLFTDTHLTSDPKHEYRWKFYDDMVEEVSKNEYDAIFVLGDICDKKDKHSSLLVNRVVDIFQKLSEHATVYILKGNHDHPDGGTAFWKFLGKINNIHYIHEPTLYNVCNKKCLFLPHSRDTKKDWAGIEKYLPADYVLLHQTVSGVKLSSGIELEGSDFDIGIFKDSKVISGDIHTPPKIKNVLYIGSPYQIHFGDNYQGHYAVITDNDITSIPVHSPKLSVVELREGDDLSLMMERYKGDYVRIRFYMPMKTMESWVHYKEMLLEICESNNTIVDSIEVILQTTDIEKVHEEVIQDIRCTLDPNIIFDEFVKSENLDNEKLVQSGRNILKEILHG